MKSIPPYRWKRRIVQFATLILIVLVPASGLLRIDLTSASFLILGHQVLWSNFTLVSGLALVFVTGPILTYMTIGTVWCGWACPQNLLSEWADKLTHKLLGKRARDATVRPLAGVSVLYNMTRLTLPVRNGGNAQKVICRTRRPRTKGH